jgi:hypothetical protein
VERTQLFAEVLEAVDQLSWDEQEILVAIVQRRMAERGRQRLAAEIQEARREFAQGLCRPGRVDELIQEVAEFWDTHDLADFEERM